MDWSTVCYNKRKFSDTNEENPAKKNLHTTQSQETIAKSTKDYKPLITEYRKDNKDSYLVWIQPAGSILNTDYYYLTKIVIILVSLIA